MGDLQSAQYPLQRRFIVWGLWAALMGVILLSPLAGVSLLVLFVVVGALWRRDEPPALAFILAYQWLYIVGGYFYRDVTGYVPGFTNLGDFEGAVSLSLIGLLSLAAGMRFGFHLLRRRLISAQRRAQASMPRYDVRRLFWYVVALFTINFFVTILPKAIFFDASEMIASMLTFRLIFLYVLFLAVVQQRRGYLYGAAALFYVLIPQFASMMSEFKDILVYLLLAMLSEWRPWSKSISDRRGAYRIGRAAAALTIVIFAMAMMWQGAIKSIWRPMYYSGAVTGTPTDRARLFFSVAGEAVPGMDWGMAVESLVARLSGIYFFGAVLERVPELVPHEDGRLTLRALEHVTKPRLFFPEKGYLGSDSWLIREYAGVAAAGEETGTSIGLGYMPEFYIDFGVPGMFIAIFFYGLLWAFVYSGTYLLCSQHHFSSGAITVMFILTVPNYEGEIAKLAGGLLTSFFIFGGLLHLFGPRLHQSLLVRSQKSESRRKQRSVSLRTSPIELIPTSGALNSGSPDL